MPRALAEEVHGFKLLDRSEQLLLTRENKQGTLISLTERSTLNPEQIMSGLVRRSQEGSTR
jgi:hypothetical protein